MARVRVRARFTDRARDRVSRARVCRVRVSVGKMLGQMDGFLKIIFHREDFRI